VQLKQPTSQVSQTKFFLSIALLSTLLALIASSQSVNLSMQVTQLSIPYEQSEQFKTLHLRHEAPASYNKYPIKQKAHLTSVVPDGAHVRQKGILHTLHRATGEVTKRYPVSQPEHLPSMSQVVQCPLLGPN